MVEHLSSIYRYVTPHQQMPILFFWTWSFQCSW